VYPFSTAGLYQFTSADNNGVVEVRRRILGVELFGDVVFGLCVVFVPEFIVALAEVAPDDGVVGVEVDGGLELVFAVFDMALPY